MTANISVTEGVGKTVSTEDIGGVQYQKIKVVGGETGSTSVLGVNPDRSIFVSVLGRPSISGRVDASIVGTVPVTQAGTFVASVSGTAGASVIGTVPVVQSGTHTVSVSGIVTPYAPTASFVSGVTSIITSTSQTSVLATAPGAQRNYITQVLVTNAAVTGTFVDLMDGPNVIYSGYAAASGGGFALSFPVPLRQSNSVTSLDVKVRTQASVIAAVSGFTAA